MNRAHDFERLDGLIRTLALHRIGVQTADLQASGEILEKCVKIER
jgi:hypothetical protein